MRKRIIGEVPQRETGDEHQWLPLEALAEVEVTSEDPAHPIESALMPGGGSLGWRAATSGEQTLRLRFDTPQHISRIRLVFEETEARRMQEFVLCWSPAGELGAREIVRQQYNFSPPETTTEVEEYNVQLSGVATLELIIVPDVQRGNAPARLKELRLAP
ncbi:MAG TPA: hypothetical protein VG095_03320 [Chthoniobacterales bacterium]|nr:hypothetical protein [Chthoniobacterales bacterium]